MGLRYAPRMSTLLVIDSSGRVNRSITRQLTARFVESWQAAHPEGTVVRRDVGQNPPPVVSEPWIAAAYSDPSQHDEAMKAAIAPSDELIAELMAADAVVFGVPIYNFAVPAQLKAWIDQVVRVNQTFKFDPEVDGNYVPLVPDKPVVVLVSAGDIELHPGGELEPYNFMEPHLQMLLGFIGITSVQFVRTGNDEFKDDRHKESVNAALTEIDRLAQSILA